MKAISITEDLAAPPDKLFAVLEDYANYSEIIARTKSRLIRPGTLERNGVGAVREMASPPMWFHEEIVAFERPRLIEYRIVASRPAIEHEIGRIILEPIPTGTRATWTTTLRIVTPLVGWILTPPFTKLLGGGFSDTLKAASRKALGQ